MINDSAWKGATRRKRPVIVSIELGTADAGETNKERIKRGLTKSSQSRQDEARHGLNKAECSENQNCYGDNV